MKGDITINRNSNIELLRIILMYAVLLWHVFVHGGHISAFGTSAYTIHPNTLYELLICSVLCIAVDCFIFISGYFGITFKWRTLLSFVLMGVFYSALTFCISIFFGISSLSDEATLYKVLCPFTSKLWWFFSYYLVIYMLSPLLNTIDDIVQSKKQYVLLLIFIYITGYLYHVLAGKISNISAIAQPFNMLFIYMLGRFMHKYKMTISGWYFVIAEAILMSLITLLYKAGNIQIWHVYTNGNPIVILAAISLFFFFYSRKYENKKVNTYASCVFAIYLATDAFLGKWLYDYLYHMLYNNVALSIIIIIIIGSSIVGIEYIRKRIMNSMLY